MELYLMMDEGKINKMAEMNERKDKLNIRFAAIVLLLLLSSACVYLMLRRQKPALGQNYSTVGTTSPTDPLPME